MSEEGREEIALTVLSKLRVRPMKRARLLCPESLYRESYQSIALQSEVLVGLQSQGKGLGRGARGARRPYLLRVGLASWRSCPEFHVILLHVQEAIIALSVWSRIHTALQVTVSLQKTYSIVNALLCSGSALYSERSWRSRRTTPAILMWDTLSGCFVTASVWLIAAHIVQMLVQM